MCIILDLLLSYILFESSIILYTYIWLLLNYNTVAIVCTNPGTYKAGFSMHSTYTPIGENLACVSCDYCRTGHGMQ